MSMLQEEIRRRLITQAAQATPVVLSSAREGPAITGFGLFDRHFEHFRLTDRVIPRPTQVRPIDGCHLFDLMWFKEGPLSQEMEA